MSGYFLVILFLWFLILGVTKVFSLGILPSYRKLSYIVALIFIFVIPGFLVDWIALYFEWYIFPETTKYLWITPIGVPVEEAFFFFSVPVWIIVLWKLSKKIVD